MYTICYVLTDEVELFYYNQLLISVASLRRRNFLHDICVVMDKETERLLVEGNRGELKEFGVETITVQIPIGYSQKEKSRYIKTSMREYIKGDFLYIDTDTIIADELPDEVQYSDIALVREWNVETIDRMDISSIQKKYQECGFELNLKYGYYNSGVIWARDTDTSHQFFKEWHKEWCHCRSCGVLQDQPSLNFVNCNLGGIISELDGIWNVQISCVMSLQYLKKSIIIHYYNVSWERMHAIYLLANPQIQKKGVQSEEVKKIIDDPRNALVPSLFIRSEDEIEEVLHSKSFFALKQLYTRHPIVYRMINYVLSALVKN